MRKFFKLLGIIALVAVLGLSIIACDENDDSGGNGGSGGGSNSGGVFTLDGIPSKYNGYYAGLRTSYIESGGYINGAQNITLDTTTLARISNGKVYIPMWVIKGNNISRYSVNDIVSVTVLSCDSEIYTEALEMAQIHFDSITFSNGNAERNSWEANDIYEIDNVGGLSGTWVGNIGGNNITFRANDENIVITTTPYRTRGSYSIVDNTFSLTISGFGYHTGKILNSNTITISISPNSLFPVGTYTFYKQ